MKNTQVASGVEQTLLLSSSGQAVPGTWVLTTQSGGAPGLVSVPLRVPLCFQSHRPGLLEELFSPTDNRSAGAPGEVRFSQHPGGQTLKTREVKNCHLQILDEPPEMLWDC